jgi:hypothetical protein
LGNDLTVPRNWVDGGQGTGEVAVYDPDGLPRLIGVNRPTGYWLDRMGFDTPEKWSRGTIFSVKRAGQPHGPGAVMKQIGVFGAWVGMEDVGFTHPTAR